MPHAAAATVARSRSSVANPSLNPSPSAPREHEGAHELEPGRVGCDHERRDPLVALPPVGGREDGVKVRNSGVRDEGLHAGENVAVAVPCRGRRNRGHVRARFGLGHRERRHRPAGEDGGEPAVLELARARQQDRHGAQGLEREHGVRERRGARQGLAHEARRAQVLVCDRREPARLAEPCQEIARLGPRGGVVGGLGEGGDFARRVVRGPRRQGDVGLSQEGANGGRIGHGQTNLGSRFALKAS